MPRFVLLAHDWPAPHLDLLLEAGPVLRAWRLHGDPAAGHPVPAEPNAAHRLLYLDYDGPVSGGRGEVRRWDTGTFDWVEDGPRRVVVDLRGARLAGRFALVPTAGGWAFGPATAPAG
ncbi:MAG TPA: DNA polymerase ligase N-terminal domain-containing protein, partial [Urbifossiella sp.]|nr:DNA polymerase ligase N-terminal domain-containing protein [Urbifossiella sp.]